MLPSLSACLRFPICSPWKKICAFYCAFVPVRFCWHCENQTFPILNNSKRAMFSLVVWQKLEGCMYHWCHVSFFHSFLMSSFIHSFIHSCIKIICFGEKNRKRRRKKNQQSASYFLPVLLYLQWSHYFVNYQFYLVEFTQIKILYWHWWFHQEPGKSMGPFHSTKGSFIVEKDFLD